MSILATLRPSGNAGDQDAGTAITASATNSGGVSQATTVATADLPLSNSGLGGQAFDAIEFSVMASVATTGTVTGIALVVVQGASEQSVAISGTGAWETSTPLDVDPAGDQWTGDRADSLALRVEVDVLLPPGATATLSVFELKAELMQDSGFSRTATGLAGEALGYGAAGAVAAGGTV